MAVYKYRAKKGVKEIIEGDIEAKDEKNAIEKLSQDGYLPISILEEKEFVQSSSDALDNLRAGKFKIKSRNVTVFTRQLAGLLRAGMPILRALSIISEQSEDIKLKSILKDVYNGVKEGNSLSSILSRYPNVFSPLYIGMICAGEDSGDLPEVLLRIAAYRVKHEEAVSRLRVALVYPLIMAIVGAGTVIFMLTFVIPRLTKIFLNMGQELPLPTRILISISQGLLNGWYWIVLVLGVVALFIRQKTKTAGGKLWISRFKLRLPLFGNLILKVELFHFCRTMELLIRNGVPILNAIHIAIPVLSNEIIKKQIEGSREELEQGYSFGMSLKKSEWIPLFMSNLIIVGEESGKLDEALAEVGNDYEKDTDEAVKMTTNLLEPLMILVMGLIIGFIVVAMLLPIFEINL